VAREGIDVDFSQLQRAVQRHVLQADAAVLPHINESQRVPVAVRLRIYSDGYRLRLIEALADNYSQLQAVLGDEAFVALALEYIDAHPSTHFSIRWFGADLGTHLLTTRPTQPWFAELAQWEWALTCAFDAADATPVAVEALASVEPERWWSLRFDLHPSVQQLAMQTNAPEVYKALSNDTDPPEPVILDTQQDWLLWRQDLTTNFRSAAASEARALHLVRSDATFEDLCEALCDWYPEDEVPTHAASLLKSWLTAGMIVNIR
jgi:Putative DNA-binding domain